MLSVYDIDHIGKYDIYSHFCQCESCHRITLLSSYSTVRFAKLFKIPLIPLGRFRVVDECPQCGHRGEVSVRTLAKERKRNLSTMMKGFAQNPDNPDNCAHALHTLMVYHLESWFHDVRKTYGTRFDTDMDIQYLIAQGLSRFGEYREAMNYCRKAIVLGAGKKAEELLFHCQTLVDASENTVNLDALKVAPSSVIPAFIPLGILLSGIVAASALFIASSLRNYKAWVVNGTLQHYSFTLDDKTYKLDPGSVRPITLRLGEHELQIEGQPPQSFTYSIPLVKQWIQKQLLVINPDDVALLAMKNPGETAVSYSDSGTIRIFPGFGSLLTDLPRLDPSQPEPDPIGFYRPKTHMEMAALMDRLGLPETSIRYARKMLLMEPATTEAIELLDHALRNSSDAEVDGFLVHGLEARPILLAWHQYYQNHMASVHPDHNLEREYTLLCRDNPDDSAGYYLLATVLKDRKSAYSLYEHADRDNRLGGLGHYAIALDLFDRGQFKEALPYLQGALDQSPNNGQFLALEKDLLLALRNFDALLKLAANTEAGADPEAAAENVVLYLTCAGYHREAADEIAKQAQTNPGLLSRLNAARFYAVGNIPDFLDNLNERNDPHANLVRALHMDDVALAVAAANEIEASYWERLQLFCVARNQGKDDMAKEQLGLVLEQAGKGSFIDRRIARMIGSDAPPTPDSVQEIAIDPEQKAVLFVALGYRFPAMQREFNELALLYNFRPRPPQLLVRKWVRESISTRTAAP